MRSTLQDCGEAWTSGPLFWFGAPRMVPLDTRMEALGGTVLRTWRADFEDEQIEHEIAARRAEFGRIGEQVATRASRKSRLRDQNLMVRAGM